MQLIGRNDSEQSKSMFSFTDTNANIFNSTKNLKNGMFEAIFKTNMECDLRIDYRSESWNKNEMKINY